MIFTRNLGYKTIYFLFLLLLSYSVYAKTDLLAEGLKDWKSHNFVGKTRYSIVGNNVIKAVSNGTASGIFYEKKIDLDKTPILSWKWKVTRAVSPDNEKNKAGDDFSARIYVLKANKLLFWKTITLNYVWAAKAATGSSWSSPYSNNSRMIVKTSGSANSWKSVKVNLKQDFKRYFGKNIRYIDAIAIMTDTDNTKGSAVAYYSALRLSAR